MSFYSFAGVDVAMVMNGVIDLSMPVPPDFNGMSVDQLHDESIMAVDPFAPIAAGRRWYLIVNSSTPLNQYQSYNNDGVYTFDPDAKVVRVVYTIRDWTTAEIRVFQLSHPRRINLRALRYRFTPDELAGMEVAMQDKPNATAPEAQAAAMARVLVHDVFTLDYGLTSLNLNDPNLQARVQKMETVGLIAAGRADQIIWTDPTSYET